MTGRSMTLRQASFLSDGFEVYSIDPPDSPLGEDPLVFTIPAESYPDSSLEALHRILKRLGRMELPGRDNLEAYLRHVTRRNRRPKTLESLFTSIIFFLGLLKDIGKARLEEVTRGDVEVFIEHEQDRGIKITTIRTRLVCIHAFLRHMVEEGVVSPDVFGRRIRLHLPERLPRAMGPDDLRSFVGVIDHTRDRAMILVLLRTGMRIGELLGTKVRDIHLKERRIEIYEGEKNRLGRVVYLSDDVLGALQAWMRERNPSKEHLFYGQSRRGSMSYATARNRFMLYIERAGLSHKGYTVHTLRHTFATELLNAGMRLECLQVLLGHRSIEETRRYAQLTDKTREEEYFKAIAKIERGAIIADDRYDHELAAILETQEHIAQHG
jgi:integrase/recombinase XerD